jgi:hypothetical protein
VYRSKESAWQYLEQRIHQKLSVIKNKSKQWHSSLRVYWR